MNRDQSGEFQYSPFPDLDDPLPERLGQFPRQPDISIEILRLMGSSFMVAMLRAQFRLVVKE